MNQVQLVGRLSADPKIYDNGTSKTVFINIAIKRDYKNVNGEYESDFIDCKAFGRNGEFISQYSKQGYLVSVIGRLEKRKYFNERLKENQYETSVIIDKIRILGKPQSVQSVQSQVQTSTNHTQVQAQVEEDPYESFGQEVIIQDGDLPF